MRNADESQKSKHDKICAMTVATRVSSAGRASDAHRDRQVFHQKHGHMPRIPPVAPWFFRGVGRSFPWEVDWNILLLDCALIARSLLR